LLPVVQKPSFFGEGGASGNRDNPKRSDHSPLEVKTYIHTCTIEMNQLPLWPVPHAILNLLVFFFQSGITHFLKEVAMINNGLPNLVTKRYYSK